MVFDGISGSALDAGLGGFVDDREMRAWRLFLEVHARLMARLESELRDETGMPLTWYDVLVQLAEAPGSRLRMQDLARRVLISKSGLTRLVDRLCAAGYLTREPDPEDGRGTLAVMTTKGRDALRDASPFHLAGVQRAFVDRLSAREVEAMGSALEHIAEGLEDADRPE